MANVRRGGSMANVKFGCLSEEDDWLPFVMTCSLFFGVDPINLSLPFSLPSAPLFLYLDCPDGERAYVQKIPSVCNIIKAIE